MRLYRHYKDKSYRLLGTAKHSETLEDMALYECRYDNPLARIWVRPQKMFMEKVEIDGKLVPRFAEIPIEIGAHTEVSDSQCTELMQLGHSLLGALQAETIAKRLACHPRLLLLTAHADAQLVGFKLGYELEPQIFYSWLGAVHSDYQRLGIATQLMEAQHQWCREHGYTRVQTKTENRFKPMLMLNLQAGFDVTGVQNAGDKMKILMQKNLME